MSRISWIVSWLAASACAGGGSGSKGADAQPPRVDLNSGSWQLEQVSHTAMTISNGAALAFGSDGTAFAAWMEPDITNVSDEDIVTSIKTGGAWASADPRTNDTDVQNAYPRLINSGSAMNLVWGGYPNGDNDLFYSRYSNGTWTARADLTTGFETSPDLRRDDRVPAFAIGPGGQMAIAYSSSPTDTNGNPIGQFEIRVLRLDASGTPQGMPETAIPAPGTDSCDASSIAFDSAGKLHVAADCGPIGNEDIYYASDEGGSWMSSIIPGGGGRDDWGSDIAIDPDGMTVHLVWTGWKACTSGGSCADILYRRIHPGRLFDPEQNVTKTADTSEMVPSITVDSYGRPIVAFHEPNAQNYMDVYVTWSDDGGSTFATPRDVTPGTDTQDDEFPFITVEPSTGMPHIVLESVISTNPINAEIFHAELVAP